MGADDAQVLGDETGAAGLAASAGTTGAASPLTDADVRRVVDDALAAYGAAKGADLRGVADAAAEAAAGKVAETDGAAQVVTLAEGQWEHVTRADGYVLALLLVLVALAGAAFGAHLGQALFEGWR